MSDKVLAKVAGKRDYRGGISCISAGNPKRAAGICSKSAVSGSVFGSVDFSPYVCAAWRG